MLSPPRYFISKSWIISKTCMHACRGGWDIPDGCLRLEISPNSWSTQVLILLLEILGRLLFGLGLGIFGVLGYCDISGQVWTLRGAECTWIFGSLTLGHCSSFGWEIKECYCLYTFQDFSILDLLWTVRKFNASLSLNGHSVLGNWINS